MKKRLFPRNIDGKGRLVRALLALGLFVGAGFGFSASGWLGVALLVLGVFVAFEAARGWCVVRACGIRTKL